MNERLDKETGNQEGDLDGSVYDFMVQNKLVVINNENCLLCQFQAKTLSNMHRKLQFYYYSLLYKCKVNINIK